MKFRVGDIVKVIEPEGIYERYDTVFRIMKFKNLTHNYWDTQKQWHQLFRIASGLKHPDQSIMPDVELYKLIGIADGKEVLMGHVYIKLAHKPITKLKIL